MHFRPAEKPPRPSPDPYMTSFGHEAPPAPNGFYYKPLRLPPKAHPHQADPSPSASSTSPNFYYKPLNLEPKEVRPHFHKPPIKVHHHRLPPPPPPPPEPHHHQNPYVELTTPHPLVFGFKPLKKALASSFPPLPRLPKFLPPPPDLSFFGKKRPRPHRSHRRPLRTTYQDSKKPVRFPKNA